MVLYNINYEYTNSKREACQRVANKKSKGIIGQNIDRDDTKEYECLSLDEDILLDRNEWTRMIYVLNLV